jgi:hypothetical protein
MIVVLLVVVATQQPTELDMTFMMTMQEGLGVALLDVEYFTTAIDADTRESKKDAINFLCAQD